MPCSIEQQGQPLPWSQLAGSDDVPDLSRRSSSPAPLLCMNIRFRAQQNDEANGREKKAVSEHVDSIVGSWGSWLGRGYPSRSQVTVTKV